MSLILVHIGFLIGLLPSLQDPPPGAVQADDETQKRQRLLRSFSIEQLMNIDVYSASRRNEPVIKTPAAVTIIRGDDLRRMTNG